MRIVGDILLAIGALVLGPIHTASYRFAARSDLAWRGSLLATHSGRRNDAYRFLVGASAGAAICVATVVLAGAPLAGGGPIERALVLGSGGLGTLVGGLLGAATRKGRARG